jgi:hypothetical protein
VPSFTGFLALQLFHLYLLFLPFKSITWSTLPAISCNLIPTLLSFVGDCTASFIAFSLCSSIGSLNHFADGACVGIMRTLPIEDTENVPVSAPEPAPGEQRVRVRMREAVLYQSSVRLPLTHHIFEVANKAKCYFWCRVFLQQRHNSNIWAAQGKQVQCCCRDAVCCVRCTCTAPVVPAPKQWHTSTKGASFYCILGRIIVISTAWAMCSQMGPLAFTLLE